MKILLSESKLKKLVGDRFGLDLTNKIFIITNTYQLPMHWDRHFNPTQVNRLLNNRGPLYLVEYGKKEYLVIPKDREKEGKGWWVSDQDGDLFDESKFMKILGIEILGLGFDELLDMFFDENKNINETYNPDDEPNYKVIEKVINKAMSKSFDWWKELSIYDLKFAQSRFREGYYFIDGKLRVDLDWGASQWRHYHYSYPFPGNSAWDDENDYSYTYFGDIIGGEEADEVRQKLLMILNSFYVETFKDIRFSAIRLYFE